MLKDRILKGIFELYNKLYKNFWFLIKKKEKRTFRLMNTVIKINKIIIRDINFSLSADKFFKEFAKIKIISFINIFFSYN